MAKRDEIFKIVSTKIRHILYLANLDFDVVQEIRIRVQEPFMITYNGVEKFMSDQGQFVNSSEEAYRISVMDIKETLAYISSYSLYAYEDEIRKGFITVVGGHRVGLAGKVVLEKEYVKSVKNISFVNIRVSHEKKGCGEPVLPYLFENGLFCHTLIVSPPGCGKTTLLRDVIRLVSNGSNERKGITVGVVDERSEIGACYQGIPQNDIGIRTDVLDCCPKAEGMIMMIRSMSPEVIAVDEIGKREDIEAIAYVMNCGCRMLATIHGSSIDDIRNKPIFRKLVEERLFKRFIFLSKKEHPGNIEKIFDEQGNVLYTE